MVTFGKAQIHVLKILVTLVQQKYMYQWYITNTLPNIFWYIRCNSSGGTHKLQHGTR